MSTFTDKLRKKGVAPGYLDPGWEAQHDAEAGVPAAASKGRMRERDYRANPMPQPDGPPPAKNLRKS
jgi:hypothetical protein